MSCNILGNGVLETEEVCIHLLKYYHRHRRVKRQVLILTIRVLLRLHFRQVESKPVVESNEGLPNSGGHHPGIRDKHEGCLYELLVKSARGLGSAPLAPEYWINMHIYSAPSIEYKTPLDSCCQIW